MSTLVILRAPADLRKIEELANSEPNPFAQLRDLAPQAALRHRVFATDDEVIVVDEWESPEQFQQWIARPDVQEVIAKAGVTTQPDITLARKLELGDDLG